MAIYLDSLSAHKAIKVRNFVKENDISLIWNPIYSPDANPIEWAFAKTKIVLKKLKLGCLVRGEEIDSSKLIKEAFKSISHENARNYIRKGLEMLDNIA